MNSRYKACLFFLILSYIPFLGQVEFVINAILFLNITLSLWQESSPNKVPKVLRLGLMVSGLALIFNSYGTLWGLEPGVSALSLMATLKIFELVSKRDFFLFVLIVELSLIGHVLTVNDLYMIGYVAILSIGLFALLFSFHSNDKSIKWDPERRKVFSLIILASFPLALILFFIFPRVTLGNIFFNTVKKVAKTGFSDEIKPGSIKRIIKSSTPYFRAKFLNDKAPSFSELYWRGAVLNKTTNGMIWKRKKVKHRESSFKREKSKYIYEVTFNNFMNSSLFLLEKTMGFERKSKGYMLNMGANTYKFYPYGNQKILYRGHTGNNLTNEIDEKEKKLYLELPDDELFPKFKEFASRVDVINPFTAGRFFSEYLKKNGFEYSLQPGLLKGKRPLDEFFFDSKIGFCEHFSAAFAIFLRLKKIPSRVVVGFQGGEFNPIGKYYLVTGKDAHAWVEAWDDRKGWIRLDPTAWLNPERISIGSLSYYITNEKRQNLPIDIYLEKRSGEFWQGLKFMLDMIYYEANQEFISYDSNKQEQLFSFLGKFKRHFSLKLVVLCILCLLIFTIPMYFLLKKEVLVEGVEFKYYRQFLSKLIKAGVQIQNWYGPERVLKVACQKFPLLHPELSEIIKLFLVSAYGNAEKRDVERLKFLVKKLRIPKGHGNS